MDKSNLIEFLSFSIPLLKDGLKIGEIVDAYIRVKDFKESILNNNSNKLKR